MKKINILYGAALLLAASCTNDITLSVTSTDGGTELPSSFIGFRGFTNANGGLSTRTAVLTDEGHIAPVWSAGDAIGIFPYSPVANSQLKYTMNEFYTYAEMNEITSQYQYGKAWGYNSAMGMDASGHVAGMLEFGDKEVDCVAKFDGEGFGLIDGETYLAYYPYDDKSDGFDQQNFCKHIPNIRFDGQKQYGNGSVSYLADYLYLYGEPAAPINGSIPIWMNPSTAVVTFLAKVPVGHIYTEAKLFVEMTDDTRDSLFYKEATMDITDWGKLAAKRNSEGKFDESNQYLTIDLYDESHKRGIEVVEEDAEDGFGFLRISMMVPPTYIGEKPIKAIIYDATENTNWVANTQIRPDENTLAAVGGVNWNPNVDPIQGFCAGVVYYIDNFIKTPDIITTTSVEWHPALPDYYAWGETVPEGKPYPNNGNNYIYNQNAFPDMDDYSIKKDFSWETYKYVDLDDPHNEANPENFSRGITKYQIDDHSTSSMWYEQTGESGGAMAYEFVGDGMDRLRPEDDAARVLLGDEWRIPTKAEFNELATECTWTWVSKVGKYLLPGYEVTDKYGNTLFLPAAGGKYYDSRQGKTDFLPAAPYGEVGLYWTSQLSIWSSCAASFSIDKNSHSVGFNPERCDGLTIIPVRTIKGNEALQHEGGITWKNKRQ